MFVGTRFRKSIKIAPGVRINVGRKSVGMSIGGKYGGMSFNSRTGARARVSAPGTGLSYSTKISGGNRKRTDSSLGTRNTQSDDTRAVKKRGTIRKILGVVFAIIAIRSVIVTFSSSTDFLDIIINAFVVGVCGYISVLFFKPSVLGPTNDDSDIELDDYTALYDEDTSDDFEEKVKGPLLPFSVDAWDGYVSPSGGYVNYARWQVIGINPKTNRKNKRVYETRREEQAIKCAIDEGFEAPFEVTAIPFDPPSERQLDYANSIGTYVPPEACRYDVSAMLSRYEDDDEEPVDEKIAKMANIYGIMFSRYAGKKAILNKAHQLPKMEYNGFIYAISDNKNGI